MKIEIKVNVTSTIINNVLCCALEGGSNYWYAIGDVDRKHFIKGDPFVDNLTRSFDLEPSYELDVYDIESIEYDEDEDEGTMDKLGTLTLASMAEALSFMAEYYPEEFGRIMDMSCDADDADIFFQIAVMGEIVFG